MQVFILDNISDEFETIKPYKRNTFYCGKIKTIKTSTR